MAGRVPAPLVAYGPFYGMRYTSDGEADPGLVYDALNFLPADPMGGGPYVRRPGDARGTVAASAVEVQWVGIFYQTTGFRNIAVVAGELWDIDGSTWTKRITTANLTAAGITLAATRRCHAVTYTDKLIVHDNVHQPFMWDGTAGGGLTLLSNAPTIAYGRPVVYYGKLFFIKASASYTPTGTMVWSEENAPNTGYEAGGYSNTWTLTQSGAGAFYGLAATNTGLYYLRAQGIGVVQGAVSPTFTADGVHEGISTTLGTTNPASVVVSGEDVWFAETQASRPAVIVGGRVRLLGDQVGDFEAIAPTAAQATTPGPAVRTALIPTYRAVAFAYRATFPGESTYVVLLYSIDTYRCLARISFLYNLFVHAANVSEPPVIGPHYDSVRAETGLLAIAQNGGQTYSLRTPSFSPTRYTQSNPPADGFHVTLPGIDAPPDHAFAPQHVEVRYGLYPGASTDATSATVAVRSTDTKAQGGTTTDLGTTSLTPGTAPTSDTRTEVREVLGFTDLRRRLQFVVRDSGTLCTYPWALKRLRVYGTLEPIDPEMP